MTSFDIDEGNYASITIVPIGEGKNVEVFDPNLSTYDESNKKAVRASVFVPRGGGMRSTMLFSTESVPRPVLAEMWRISEGSIPNVAFICAATMSG